MDDESQAVGSREGLAPEATPKSSAMILRLPNEILVEIFRHVQHMMKDLLRQRRKVTPWYQLLRVCKHWFTVARASPILWRTIELEENTDPTLLQYSLTYSGDMTVDILLQYTEDPMAPITSILSPHAHRIRALNLDELKHMTEYALASLLYHPMPALEELHVSFYSEGDDGEDELDPLNPDQQEDEEGDPIRYPFFWFPKAEQFPKIVELTLGRSVGFNLRMPVFPTLKRLTLSYCIVLGVVSLKDFLQYVRKHPVLEELTLRRINLALTDGSSLRLPSTLRKFSLEDFPLNIAGFLAKLSPLPTDLNVHLNRRLRYLDPNSEPETPITALYSLPRDRSVLPILSLVQSIAVLQSWWQEYELVGCTPTGTEVTLAGWLPEDPPERLDVLRDLRDAFGAAPVTELRVDGHDEHKVTADGWKQTLALFSGLRRIAVVDTKDAEDDDEDDGEDEEEDATEESDEDEDGESTGSDQGEDEEEGGDNPEESAGENATEHADDEGNENAKVRRPVNACTALLDALREPPSSPDSPPVCAQLESLELVATDPNYDRGLAGEIADILALRTSRGQPLKTLTIWVKTDRKDLKADSEFAIKRRAPFLAALRSLVQELRFEDRSH
ncbi:hypothetical protein C8Q76DRAFT_179515 [Earliella scabrosa]|nr:hypothetical protein C8Q76DRAFT_179515 [Earliella scabrosa]